MVADYFGGGGLLGRTVENGVGIEAESFDLAAGPAVVGIAGEDGTSPAPFDFL
jgi:hypothetical protein